MCSLSPCNCVLRAIFRICYDRFIRCATQEPYLSRISVEPHVGKHRAATWGSKDEEYLADFCLVTRRNRMISSIVCSVTIFFSVRPGGYVAGSSESTAARFFMRFIGLNRSQGGSSGNWSHIRCSL